MAGRMERCTCALPPVMAHVNMPRAGCRQDAASEGCLRNEGDGVFLLGSTSTASSVTAGNPRPLPKGYFRYLGTAVPPSREEPPLEVFKEAAMIQCGVLRDGMV